MEQQESKLAGDLPDCSGLTLRDIDVLDKSVFASVLRDLMSPGRRDTEPIAGFTSVT
ncbi:FXSXX-COOH protein [Nonomuraea fuscirosea]|uniref:FXSXX-COOH protein n=1 Tax=Nonomuraea fuscirosea TaxID=1291556 RepID=UPI0033D9F12A